MLECIELIIYDLDGVLIDSSEAICETFNKVLNEVGELSHPKGRIKEMIGEPLRDMYKKVLPAEKHSQIEFCFNRYVEIFKQIAVRYTHLLDGVEDTLSYFKERGLKQSVATSKSADETDILLKGLSVRQYFDLLLGVTDVTKPKPDPEIIYLTLQRARVNGKDSVFVGDTTGDLVAGKSAGVHTVAITTGTHPRELLSSLNPDYIINNIRELKGLITL